MKLRPFELALVIIFIGLALLALFLLATYEPKAKTNDGGLAVVGNVTIWGTLPFEAVNGVIKELSLVDEAYKKVSYQYYDPNEFDLKLLNALADNTGPDLILVSQEKLIEMRRRIQPISYQSFPIRDVRDSYLDGAQIFALDDGLYGYPIAVDPLMMYWNKDIFAAKGFLSPPATWEDLVNSVFPSLIERNSDRTITRSVVAMGEYQNVRNSFAVISALLIQGGTEGVVIGNSGQYQVNLRLSAGDNSDPLRSAADFYTRFSRPSNALYSWNRSYQDDRLEFISENLAIYFGYGSEGAQLEKINPNLNFDIAEIPQGAESTVRRTYGKFYAISLLKSSDNVAGASAVMFNFAGAQTASKLAIGSNMVPASRSAISQGSNDTYGRVNYRSAPVAFGWLNPDLEATDQIFATVTQDINENRRDLDGAISDAVKRLSSEY